MAEFQKVAEMLEEGKQLPANYRKHKLTGKYKSCWECHIEPDWLLVWKQNKKELVLLFLETGSHTDIFGM